MIFYNYLKFNVYLLMYKTILMYIKMERMQIVTKIMDVAIEIPLSKLNF